MSNILLSPIGRSPGAVTGIYYALQRQDPPVLIDRVILLCTAMPQVKQSASIVAEAIGRDKVHILSLRTQNQQTYTMDFDHEEAALDFIMHANAVLAHARWANDKVYIGISGGRSSMGALVTLSAYIYGATGVYHLWVDQDIEEKGDVGRLPPLRTERAYYLNPPPEKSRLIGLPLASFDPRWFYERLGVAFEEHPDAWKSLARAITDVEQYQVADLRRIHTDALSSGIPTHLYVRLCTTLQGSPLFYSHEALRALFSDARLSAWQTDVPESNTISNRVRETVAFLSTRRNVQGECALTLFLEALRDQSPATDAHSMNLTDLLRELGSASWQTSAHLPEPQLTESQTFDAVADHLRVILKGTELQRPLEGAIKLANRETKVNEILELAEQLKPYIKPTLWEQITYDLKDWENWKRGPERLLKFVETVAAPLAIAGVAAALGIALK